MRNLPAAILAGLALTLGTAASAQEAARPLAFLAEAKVTLDATGKPVSVEASDDLPDPVRKFIEQRVAGWRFAPPERDGANGPAVTYLQLDACALPVGNGGYRMAVDLKGNGPRYANGIAMAPPPYPRQARSRGMTAKVVVNYVVGPDGRATVEKLDYKQGARVRGEFDRTLEDWVESMRYEPEQFAGQPVPTKVSVEVAFEIRGKTKRRGREDADAGKPAAPVGECRAAIADASLDAGLQPVAHDSPVKVEPAG